MNKLIFNMTFTIDDFNVFQFLSGFKSIKLSF